MKKLLFLIFLCANTLVFSQTEDDYNNTITNITDSYNSESADAVFNLFTSDLKATLTLDSLKKKFADLKNNQGELGESTLLVEDEVGKSYLLSFENGDMLLTILLDANKKLKTFELKEY